MTLTESSGEITIDSPDTNTTYSISSENPSTGVGVIFRLSDNNSVTDDIKFQPSGSTSITRSDANTIEISSINYGAGTGISLSSNNFNLDYLGLQDLSATDGSFIVGDGSNLINESGATARASLGIFAGSGTYTTGDEVIANPNVTSSSLIFITLTTNPSSGNSLYVKSIIDGVSFTLASGAAIANPTNFNYLIINP